MDGKVVAVASSKGGAGKSSVAVNLALELHRRGAKVGFLDADVDSPYAMEILGVTEKVKLTPDRKMIPVHYRGMPTMSFATFVPDAFVGATMSGTMHKQFLSDAIQHTQWGDLDILIADCPAGTSLEEYVAIKQIAGDNFLGVIAVALPNVVGGLQRVYNTASRNHMRILGVIENMSGPIFGSGNVEAFCKKHGLRFFGSIPLDERIRRNHERQEPCLPKELMGPIETAGARLLELARIRVKTVNA